MPAHTRLGGYSTWQPRCTSAAAAAAATIDNVKQASCLPSAVAAGSAAETAAVICTACEPSIAGQRKCSFTHQDVDTFSISINKLSNHLHIWPHLSKW
jgi:hypothetical protein